MASFRERLMESGCEEDYRLSLATEGDMTYADPDWLDDWVPEYGDEEEDVEEMINKLRNLGYKVERE